MKIEKSIKKIGIAVGAILLVIIFFVVFKMFDGNENSDRIVGNPFSQEKIEHKIYFKDMGNDWYYYFSIYSIDGKINHKFDGFNLKYASSLEYGNNPYYYIEHGPKSENVLLCGDPELKCSRKFNTVISEQDEIKKISEYFNQKKFNKQITLEDISDLKLDNFDAQLIVDLYNGAFNKEFTDEIGPFIALRDYGHYFDEMKNGYKWSIAVGGDWGFVTKIKLNLKFEDNTYLSDKIKNNTATPEQIELYNTFESIENYILEEQKIDIDKKFPEYKGEYYERLYKILPDFNNQEHRNSESDDWRTQS